MSDRQTLTTNDFENGVDPRDPMKALCDRRYHDLRDTLTEWRRMDEASMREIQAAVERQEKSVAQLTRVIGGADDKADDSGLKGIVRGLRSDIEALKKAGINWVAVISGIIIAVSASSIGGVIVAVIIRSMSRGPG